MTICMGDFALRHFRPDFEGTKVSSHDPESFICDLEDLILALKPWPQELVALTTPGYAPFCQHLFVRNFTDAKLSIAQITEENQHLLRTGYKARRPEELAVLTRWFEREALLDIGWSDKCPWLDLILYSQAQMAKEGHPIDSDWAVISINSTTGPQEDPMPPITMMRNALGVAEGGSGVPLDRAAYELSVQYWTAHALVR